MTKIEEDLDERLSRMEARLDGFIEASNRVAKFQSKRIDMIAEKVGFPILQALND